MKTKLGVFASRGGTGMAVGADKMTEGHFNEILSLFS